MQSSWISSLCVGALLVGASAHAAAPPSVAGFLQRGGTAFEKINIPTLGSASTLSLFSASQAYPVINKIRVPVIGTLPGIPVFGSLPPGQGLATLEAIAPFKQSLGK